MSDSLSLPMAAIGSYEMVLPFQAVGVRPFILEADKRDTFERTLDKLARENYAVVFVQEDLFVDFIHKVRRSTTPTPPASCPCPDFPAAPARAWPPSATASRRPWAWTFLRTDRKGILLYFEFFPGVP